MSPPTTGAARFERAAVPAPRRSAPAAVGAVLALLVLVVGVPAVLVLLDGAPPVPTSLPDRETFTQAVGVEQVVTFLVAVVWLAWLQFLACLVVEVRSALHGASLPRPVPLSGPSQRLARTLVGVLLLTGTVAGPVSAAVAATTLDAPAPAGTAAVQVVDAAGGDLLTDPPPSFSGVPVAPSIGGSGAALTSVLTSGATQGPVDDAVAGRRVYTVQAPVNGYHDNLWDIAERHLGDGRRYTEIYALNEGREQPDGRTLELARLIQPGWQLVMPEDAVGVARVAVQAPAQAPAPPAGEAAGPAGGSAAVDEAPGFSGVPLPDVASPPVADMDDGAGDVADTGVAGLGALAAAGVVGALVRERRRRSGTAPDAAGVDLEVALRIGADPGRSRSLDLALRGLAAVCDRSGRPLPAVLGAVVDDGSVELVLDGPDPATIAPWTPLDHGRRWRLEGVESGRSATGTPAPYPGLVSLGRDLTGRDVLVDLGAAGGPVSVTGNPVAVREVVTAWALDLAVNPWSDASRVSTFDLPDSLASVDLDGGWTALTSPDDLDGQRLAGRFVLLGSPPPPQVLQRVLDGGPQGRGPAGVVIAGAVRDAAWTMTVDDLGTLVVGPLGVSVTANRLPADAVEPLTGLFRSAGEDAGDTGRPPVPPCGREPDQRAWATSGVRVGLLGPLDVQVAAPIEAERRDVAVEVVAFLALHPEGVHPTVLAGAVWPRGVSAEVRDATVARVRAWLGSDASGRYRLGEDARGRLLLSDDVVVDHAVLMSLLRRSRTAPTPHAERDLLRGALRLLRGELGHGRPVGRYSWLPRTGVERDVVVLVVDAARRLARLETEAGDTSAAAAAVTAGLRAVPTSQPLWRDLLVAIAGCNSGELPNAVSEMRTVLASAQVPLEPETEALVEELLPGAA